MQSMLNAMYKGGTLVIGHRGASAYAPMNTLPAFELAVAQGADGIELDVHRSKDGHAVIVHDFTVDETTDGSGTVTEMTLAELKALDAGSWFDADFAGTRIPTLDEVFAAVGDKLYINIEIKSVSQETDGVEKVVADAITRAHMHRRVLVSSFNPLTLHRFRQIMPKVPLGFLYEPQTFAQTGAMMGALDLWCEAWHPQHLMIDTAYMQRAKDEGTRVNTWTVNDPDEAVMLRDLGVDGIVTDQPDVLIKALRGE